MLDVRCLKLADLLVSKLALIYGRLKMDVKLVLVILTGLFIVSALFFGTKNGYYDSDNYDGNGSAH